MKIILIGASGTIGRAIDDELKERHEIIRVGHSSGDFQVDIRDAASIRRLFEQTGRFDALISATGKVHFGALAEMGEAQFAVGLADKLMGQVNLVLIGREFANDGASFTPHLGRAQRRPDPRRLLGEHGQRRHRQLRESAAIELPRGLRINSVSPTVIEEALPSYGPFFRGYKAVPPSPPWPMPRVQKARRPARCIASGRAQASPA